MAGRSSTRALRATALKLVETRAEKPRFNSRTRSRPLAPQARSGFARERPKPVSDAARQVRLGIKTGAALRGKKMRLETKKVLL